MAKILLITEGNREKKNFQRWLKLFSINPEIFVYKTNIYQLYDKVFLPYEDDFQNLDILSLLKNLNNITEKDQEILSQKYSDILLIFDFDPHATEYTDEKIIWLLKFFNESTENGKLYINYPMFESFKHISDIDDTSTSFKDAQANIENLTKYKEIVGKESCNSLNHIDNKNIFTNVLLHHLKKANYIIYTKYTVENKTAFKHSDYEKILKKQLSVKNQSNMCHILNTSILYVLDYNPKYIF